MVENEIVFSVWESSELAYEAQAVGYPIFANAKTMEKLKANVENAVTSYFAYKKSVPTIPLVKALPNAFRFGSARGEFTVPDDFNDPLPKEIEDLFYK
ncbi:MAG TPA: hypothetical protein VN517_18440 [Terriglobales bacterium]|jgi:hypothetical protein|nr:hypothetical protein [Terriglobales bacterium]